MTQTDAGGGAWWQSPKVSFALAVYREKPVILIRFAHDVGLVGKVKRLSGARWNPAEKAWCVSDNQIYRERFGLEPKPLAGKEVLQNIHPVNHAALEKLVETLQLKAYSKNTVKTYHNEFAQLLCLLKHVPVELLDADRLRRYFLYCVNTLKLSENTLHSRINAVKFYYEQVLGRERFFVNIPRPKKKLQNPRFFNQDEVASIIKATDNLKHRTMLMLAYGTGLRVSEVVALKCYHIDGQRRCIVVEQAKGKKDRVVALSPVLLVALREYWKAYRPDKSGYLFEGQAKGEAYSSRSLQLVLAAAKRRAGVLKPGSVHALRHSFATHLLDKGTDVTMIMKLLGHNDLKTTLRYLHVTNRDLLHVISPLDDLKL